MEDWELMNYLLKRDENIDSIYTGNCALSLDDSGNPEFEFCFELFNGDKRHVRYYYYDNKEWKHISTKMHKKLDKMFEI